MMISKIIVSLKSFNKIDIIILQRINPVTQTPTTNKKINVLILIIFYIKYIKRYVLFALCRKVRPDLYPFVIL